MSLVGTRPILPDELEQYELHHRARIAIKPGITGMWQVSGRSDITDFEEIVRLDTECVALAGVIFISALLLITKIDLLLNVPQNLVFSVKLLFLIVFLNFVLTTATTPFTTAAYIKNRLDITGIIKIIAYLVDAGVMVILFINCTPNVWFVGMGSCTLRI